MKSRRSIWKKNGINLTNPGTEADKFLIRLSRSKDDIILAGPGEVIPAFQDNLCAALANILFYNSFVKKTKGQ